VLAAHAFALVLTSPLKRARRTAELAGFADAREDPDLVEIDYGEYEGLTTAQIREVNADWLMWRDGNPGGETVEQAGVRADRVIERINDAEGDVLLFGHGHFSRVLGARLLGLPPEAGQRLILAPASISIVGSEHDERAIRAWNWEQEI
jgi:broad specificity phosphatase PhoE